MTDAKQYSPAGSVSVPALSASEVSIPNASGPGTSRTPPFTTMRPFHLAPGFITIWPADAMRSPVVELAAVRNTVPEPACSSDTAPV